MMHLLLRLALAACPADYRREYRDSISSDVRSRGVSIAAAALDVAYQGLMMHADNVTRNVTFGVRSLRRAPVFVTVAVVTIALAIGANVSAASIVRGVLLSPLPYPHASRLVFLYATYRGERSSDVDYPDVHDFAQRNHTLSALSVEESISGTLTGLGRPAKLNGWSVGAQYFSLLGMKPELGRLLNAKDVGTRNIVISDELWRSRLGADPAVLGRRVTIEDRARTIVGIAASGSMNPAPGYLQQTDFWSAIDPRRRFTTDWRGYYAFEAIGRLGDGVSIAQAQSDLSRIAAHLQREYPAFDRGRGVYVEPMLETTLGPYRAVILMIYGAALLVLLIAGANIANLLLARTASRESELAIREAAGATRRKIAAQITTETALLTAPALLFGLIFGALALRALSDVVTGIMPLKQMIVPGWDSVKIDPLVALYTVALTIVFVLGASVAPVLLRQNALRKNRAGNALVIAEIALAVALMVLAGVWLRGFIALEHTPDGFTEAHRFTTQVALPQDRYGSPKAVVQFARRLRNRLQALPGVAAVAEGLSAGLGSDDETNFSLTTPIDKIAVSAPVYVAFNSVTPNFFGVLGIPLLEGRVFTAGDAESSAPVAVISRRFANAQFGSVGAALGRRVSIGETNDGTFPLRRIVGVVGDVRHSLFQLPAAEVYVPFRQVAFDGRFIIRTDGHDAGLAGEVDKTVSSIDPLLPPPQIVSLSALRAINAAPTRWAAIVFLTLAGIALLLAFAGIYGVVAYSVERRTREFGIRMALGGTRARIVAAVIQQAAVNAALGIAAGLLLGSLFAHSMSEELSQISMVEPLSLAATAAIAFGASALAAMVPVLRATALNPAVALRVE